MAPPRPVLPVIKPAPVLPAAINFVQAQNPPTPDPAAVCAANKITLTNLKKQESQTSDAVDSCDPSVKIARLTTQYINQNKEYVQQQRADFDRLHQSIQNRFKTSSDLVDSITLLKQFNNELKLEHDTAQKESVELEHKERTYRRDFLDNQPEEGVPWHVVGFQTSDDKAMLTFWICMAVFLTLLAFMYIRTYRAGVGLLYNVGVGLGIVLAPMALSWYLIMYYG